MVESELILEDQLGVMKLKEKQKIDGRVGSAPPPVSDSRIRKASYYVWFLGAEECRGLRGPEVVRPVLQYLLERERQHEPEKVTLQVSGRGIKLLQQGVTSRAAAAGSTKHFIPCGALTHVQQEESPDNDIVSAILLIYNPLTRCPFHVHAYRCDSTETAGVLRQHLHQLLLRPEQQVKLAALESRLASRGLLPSVSGSRTSDEVSSGSSVSSGAGSGSGPRTASGEKIATLYDSLAAELREKLGTKEGPLLLPPKDYDKAGRRRKKNGDAGGSSTTRKATGENDSARSSGIGSDDAPSPTQDRDMGALEQQSSSDDDWAGHETAQVRGEAGLVLVQPSWRSAGTHHPPTRSTQERGRKAPSPTCHPHQHPISPQRNRSPVRVRPTRKESRRNKDRSASSSSPRDRFQDAREKFLSLERQRSAIEACNGGASPHPEAIGRSTSWEVTSKPYPSGQVHRGRERRRAFGSREDIIWPKSDRDTGYGSRDAILRERRPRDSRDSLDPRDIREPRDLRDPRDIRDSRELRDPRDLRDPRESRDFRDARDSRDFRDSREPRDPRELRDSRDPREVEPWRREGHKTPDMWEYRATERTQSPMRGRTQTPVREHRVPRVRSPDRQEYLRAKSMHDLTQRRSATLEDERRGHDPRRHSLYDSSEERRPFAPQAQMGPSASPGTSSSSSPSRTAGVSYNELPDHQRHPGLDRATARVDHLEPRTSKRTFDYPMNGGHAPIHITRAHHDDYRKFRYDQGNPQFIRKSTVPAAHF